MSVGIAACGVGCGRPLIRHNHPHFLCHNMCLMDYGNYTDRDIVNALIENDESVIDWLFHRKCSSLLNYIISSVFHGNVDREELVNELYLYLADSDWYKVRQFDYRSRLTTWLSVVAVRFFIKKRGQLSENSASEYLNVHKQIQEGHAAPVECLVDVRSALEKMPNERYRRVIIALDLHDRAPESVAEELNITMDNLYNLHRRAKLQLRMVIREKEDYYG